MDHSAYFRLIFITNELVNLYLLKLTNPIMFYIRNFIIKQMELFTISNGCILNFINTKLPDNSAISRHQNNICQPYIEKFYYPKVIKI